MFGDSLHLCFFYCRYTKVGSERTLRSDVGRRILSEDLCLYSAVNMLPHAWNLEQAVRQRNVMFDDTYLDIIAAAQIVISPDVSNHAESLLLELENAIGGKVIVRNEKFYVLKNNDVRIELNMLAEGLQKLAVLYLLLKKGTLKNGSVLLWDNPDTGVSLKYISLIAKILCFLQQEGVQIFVATHSIFLPPALEALDSDTVAIQSTL